MQNDPTEEYSAPCTPSCLTHQRKTSSSSPSDATVKSLNVAKSPSRSIRLPFNFAQCVLRSAPAVSYNIVSLVRTKFTARPIILNRASLGMVPTSEGVGAEAGVGAFQREERSLGREDGPAREDGADSCVSVRMMPSAAQPRNWTIMSPSWALDGTKHIMPFCSTASRQVEAYRGGIAAYAARRMAWKRKTRSSWTKGDSCGVQRVLKSRYLNVEAKLREVVSGVVVQAVAMGLTMSKEVVINGGAWSCSCGSQL